MECYRRSTLRLGGCRKESIPRRLRRVLGHTEGVDLDALDPALFDLSNHRAAMKARFGGELFPNVVEAGSGLSFAEFFQNERDTGRKGIVVITIGGQG